MKIKIRSTHRPCLVTTPSRSKTLIVGGTITHVNGEEWNHPYCAILPGGAITLDDIEWEYASAPGGQHIQHPITAVIELRSFPVRGSNGNQYIVSYHSDAHWECTCPAYKYGHGKHCKHIKDYA